MSNRATQVIIDLPEGQDYVWYEDLNIVGLASRLDPAGRERALQQFRREFREECAAEIPRQRQPTLPLTCLPPSLAYVGRQVRQTL